MTTLRLRALAVMVFVTNAVIIAAEETPETPSAPVKPSRAELRDKQFDVSLDARDIERILTRLKRASELSKQRMTDAAAAAESVSGAIERGDSAAARQRAEETAKLFREIAQQLEALLTEETPQRVSAARNLAAQLAKAEQQFAQQSKQLSEQMQTAPTASGGGRSEKPPTDPKSSQGAGRNSSTDPKEQEKTNGAGENQQPPDSEPRRNGAGQSDQQKPNDNAGGGGQEKPKPDEDKDGEETKPDSAGGNGKDQDPPKAAAGNGGKREKMSPEARQQQLADRADELANRAATLLDILEAIAASEEPADKDAAEKVRAMLKETDLKNAMGGLQAAADQIRNRQFEDAQSVALDLSERLQITTQRLDAIYRAIIGPQAEDLRKLELQLLQLREKMEDLQTPAQIAAWHRAVRELLDKAEELGISETRRTELLEEMKQQGFNLDTSRVNANWQLTDGRYQMPAAYSVRLIAVQEEIQTRIQSLLLGEFASRTDDLAPPQYQNLVERYYQVLSRDTGAPRPPPAGKSSKTTP